MAEQSHSAHAGKAGAGHPGSTGSTGHAAGHGEPHGIGRYATIWVLLLLFTGLTIWTGKMDLGGANIYIAMIIATTKATLVVLFFMHLWDGGGVNRLVFVVSVLFVLVLILGVFGDLVVRWGASLPNGGPLPDHVPGMVPAPGAHGPGPVTPGH